MPKSKKPSWFGMRNAGNGVGNISILGEIGGIGIGFSEFKRELDAPRPIASGGETLIALSTTQTIG